MTDLTKIDKPFGELDVETAVTLFRHWREGGDVEFRHLDGAKIEGWMGVRFSKRSNSQNPPLYCSL